MFLKRNKVQNSAGGVAYSEDRGWKRSGFIPKNATFRIWSIFKYWAVLHGLVDLRHMCDRLLADRTQRGVTAIGNGQYRGTTAVGVGAVDPVAAWQDSEFGGLRQAHDALWFVTLTRRAHADGALQPLHLGAEPLHLGLVVLQLGAEVDDLRVLPLIRSYEVVDFSAEGGDLHLLPANLVVLLTDGENEELRWRAVGQT